MKLLNIIIIIFVFYSCDEVNEKQDTTKPIEMEGDFRNTPTSLEFVVRTNNDVYFEGSEDDIETDTIILKTHSEIYNSVYFYIE